jgi:4-hydroxy-tetrahydrodipicolinate synthase
MAEAVKIPIFIYNIPARSVVDMTPETMGQLARDYANIWGVKDAVGSMERASMQRMICGKDFIQLSAEDATSLGYNAHGGVGAISVTANVAPRLCCEFQDATLAGDYTKALEYQDRLMPLHKALFIEPGVAGAKYALAKLGKAENHVRSPILPVETSTQTAIDDALRHAGLLN